MATFLMAGGGTGGHVIPAIAVARELVSRGHRCVFVGTREGMEARLVPSAGFAIEWIRARGIQRMGPWNLIPALARLAGATLRSFRLLAKWRPAAVFSMGGYAAAPVVLAAIVRRVPVVALEPNAIPGLVTRKTARWVRRALVGFAETARWFPAGRAEVSGLPVRPEFFQTPEAEGGRPFTVLVTGGSQGSRTLNRAARGSWPLLGGAPQPVRMILQCGRSEADELRAAFERSGISGEVTAFLEDMPAAFAAASLIVCRAGAGAVAEVCAAGRPALLVPLPHAADDHQTANANVLVRAGAALSVPDAEMTGERLAREITALMAQPARLRAMGAAARELSRPGAARRAAAVLEEVACAG